MGLFEQFPYTNFHDLNLDFILKEIEKLIEEVKALDVWSEEFTEKYNQLWDLYQDLVAGNFPPAFYATMEQWFEDNAIELVGKMVKHVYFGLSQDGYMIVTIPESWKDLTFNTTGYDISTPLEPEYGHLTISY